MRFAWIIVLAVLAGCAAQSGLAPGGAAPGGMAPGSRQFEAPVARVKPAFISTLASMGMMISSLETRGKSEIIKARKAGSEVEIELEPVSRTATRARIATRTGSQENAAAIMRQAEKLLGGT